MKIFEAQQALAEAEWALEQKLSDLGLNMDEAALGWDDYDGSLEIYGVAPDVRLTDEMKALIAEAGFHICWLNHTDGMETFYYRQNDTEPHMSKETREPHHTRGEWAKRDVGIYFKLLRLEKELAQARAEITKQTPQAERKGLLYWLRNL